jgi:TonB-dependent SusC/RagA subfamily outer membrane receptor
MRKIKPFLFFTFLLYHHLQAQQVAPAFCSGRIASAENLSLANANITASRSNTSVSSDAKGNFHIPISVFPDTLLVSFVGFQTSSVIVRNNAKSIQVFLQSDNTVLESVTINTGYQKVKPNEINGSVTVIDNKTLNAQTGTNILDRLRNVTSGLSFHEGFSNGLRQSQTNIAIRGLSTINGPTDPLIVLDNFIYEGKIGNINPNDIENITVLKDAAAASIWGARAGNGVIVITTKRGRFNQGLKIEPLNNFYSTRDILIIRSTRGMFHCRRPVKCFCKEEWA